jgi:hypothetical protein
VSKHVEPVSFSAYTGTIRLRQILRTEIFTRPRSTGASRTGRTIPQEGAIDLPEALDRLVDVQTAANKRGEVKKWPDEWAKSPAAVAAAQR